MWKPIAVLLNPAQALRKYGVRGLTAKTAEYLFRPIQRVMYKRAAEAERRYYDELAGIEGAQHPIPPKILLYPTCPPPGVYVISKMCASMGFQVVSANSEDVCLAIAWEDATHVDIAPVPGVRTLNASCRDISKEAVARAFERVFGYGFHVDPTTHIGPLVEKSDRNGPHDGRIIHGPAQAVPGRVYQRIIDNQVEDRFVMDIRTPVIGNAIPFVYLKYRPLYERFSNNNTRAVRRPTSEVFSTDEVSNIVAFARAMGLDYGELDILRDRGDSRIYIVDVNKTPVGPPNHLDRFEGRRAMRELGEALAAQFMVMPHLQPSRRPMAADEGSTGIAQYRVQHGIS